ncbi:hypothetical protein GCM10009682_05440 [Luedemannella flava]|uniref:Cell envelope-related transcriptional attenuator domain-containing protein n=1 Tax=Luedemannella flava TaxID=349316 RepID=A0ABN2LES9_9ACTN
MQPRSTSTVYGSPVRRDDAGDALPPEDGEPTKGAKKKRRRFLPTDPGWAKTLLIIGAVLVIISGISGGIVVAGRVALYYATKDIPDENLLPPEIRAAGKNIDGALNILLLGLDQRKNSDAQIRTDSIILIHIPKAHDAAYLISLPRDTKVSIPPMPKFGYPGTDLAKLNEVYQYGNRKNGKPDDSPQGRTNGVTATATVINNLVPGGIKFNAVAIINFEGFKKLVEALDGVHMCIDHVVRSEHYDSKGRYHTSTSSEPGVIPYTYKKGCRDLKAWEALDYARQRYGLPNADYDRQRHQQQLLQAIFTKLMSRGTLTDVSKLMELKNAAGDLLTLDLNGVPIEDWLFSFKHLKTNNIVMVKMNAGTYASEKINGQSYERLTDDSVALLKAVHDDKVYEFLLDHSTWISKSK